MSNATLSPPPVPSSPHVPFGRLGATEKLKPSAGVVVPPPTRTLKRTSKPLTGWPASRSSITNDPKRPLTALVSFSTPLLLTPPVGSITPALAVGPPSCVPKVKVPGGGAQGSVTQSLKLAVKD